MKKKILSLMTTLVMAVGLCGVLPIISGAYSSSTSGDLEYIVLDDDTIRITEYIGTSEKVDIPETINNKTVTEIGDSAFCFKGITQITMPNSIKYIGSDSFKGTDLTNVVIPDSIIEINDYAFESCDYLKSVSMGNSIQVLGSGAFYGCEKLKSIILPDGLNEIGSSAFSGCSKLTEINIPESVCSIGKNAFSKTAILTKLTDNIKYIDNWIICVDDKTITDVVIKDGTVGIADQVFEDCNSLFNISIPDSVKHIGRYAFYNTAAFNDQNDHLIYIDNWLVGIDEYASSVDIKPDTVGVADYVALESIKAKGWYGGSDISSVNIPDSLKYIGNYAFSGLDDLISITIPSSVEFMGVHAYGFEWDPNGYNDNIYENSKIYCYKDSSAHKYAIDNKIDYELINESITIESQSRESEEVITSSQSNSTSHRELSLETFSVAPSNSSGPSLISRVLKVVVKVVKIGIVLGVVAVAVILIRKHIHKRKTNDDK